MKCTHAAKAVLEGVEQCVPHGMRHSTRASSLTIDVSMNGTTARTTAATSPDDAKRARGAVNPAWL